MLRQRISVLLICSLLLFQALATTPIVQAAGSLPSYNLQFLGSGSPAAINNDGVVVGARVNGSNYEPLVSVGGSPWSALPVLSGAVSVFPTDVNDNGVIVGVSYDAQWNAVAVRWNPVGNGYAVEVLPRLPGDSSSYATGINNLGQIVGARRALGYVPAATSGWLYSDAGGVVDLSAVYGWWSYPTAINDNGQLIGGTERLDLNTGLLEVVGNGPSNYNAITGIAINNHGQIAGSAALRSTSLNIVSVFRYDEGTGWTFIAGTSKYTAVSSLNNLGDIGYGELGAGLYLDGQGAYALNDLLAPAVIAAGWAITGSGVKINDQRLIATVGRNSVTGQTGGVLLTSAGVLSPPSTPANLQGLSHTATRMEPYNSINLTWENTSSLTRSYELQRSVSGNSTWVSLSLTPPGTATNHTDTTVAVGVTYDYRIRAVGLAGSSPWSNIVTVMAPTIPLDTTPPNVSLTSPTNGANVSGIVPVSATATDNVAIEYLEISYWNQYLGQRVILGSANNTGTLSVSWDTRNLAPAAYTLQAYAYDPMGNYAISEIQVNVSSSNVMRVTDITLSGSVKGSTASITGYVYVKNINGQVVSNANVSVRWTLPNGSTRTASAATNASGRAKFTISGSRGTYNLTVTGVTRSGYTFDSAGSVLTKSITK